MALFTAELAWYVTGRFYKDARGRLADYGYFLHLGGIAAPLFCGKRGEGTAHFTFAAVPFSAHGVKNGALELALDPEGDFDLFLQREPTGDFDAPESFARGERIARLRRTSCVVGTSVEDGDTKSAPTVFGNNVFSARLLDSTPFDFGGARYDLADMLAPGVTQFGTAAGAAIATPPRDYVAVVPFSGSAVRMG